MVGSYTRVAEEQAMKGGMLGAFAVDVSLQNVWNLRALIVDVSCSFSSTGTPHEKHARMNAANKTLAFEIAPAVVKLL